MIRTSGTDLDRAGLSGCHDRSPVRRRRYDLDARDGELRELLQDRREIMRAANS
jgi:hypothetical protein